MTPRPSLAAAALALGCNLTPTPPPAPQPAPVAAPAAAPMPPPPAPAPSPFAAMPSVGPISGHAPTAVVVMLHGYGADGADLRSVALTLAGSLPDAVFLLPDGFEPLPGSPTGRQWFPLAGNDDALRLAGTRRAVAQLIPWIDHELQARSLSHARLGVVGFSQGAMLALDLGLHMSPAPAGVVSLSGRLVDDANPTAAPAPALLVHGSADPRIPLTAAEDARTRLAHLHVRAELLTLPGVGHTITREGMAAAGTFLHERLP